MAIDVALVATSAAFGVLVIIASIYFLVYFQHPEDKWVAWWPKTVVVLGMSLSIYNVLLLPMDVANQNGSFLSSGSIPMAQIEMAFFLTTVVMGVFIVPFSMYYYEGFDTDDDDEGDKPRRAQSQILYALKWTTVLLAFFFIIASIMWWRIGTAQIQVTTTAVTPVSFSSGTLLNTLLSTDFVAAGAVKSISNKYFSVNYGVYVIAIASLLGWIVFSMFGGVGLIALPFDAFMSFKYRPRPIKLADYTAEKKAIGEQADLMLLASKEIVAMKKESIKAGGRRGRKLADAYKKKESEFKRDTMMLDYYWHRLEESYKNGGGNPLIHALNLATGVLGSLLSLAWLIHIIVYYLPLTVGARPLAPFLNTFFLSLSNIPFLGIALYALFVVYLLGTVIKGAIKMGMRVLFIQIHPIKMGETMMNSLVFNTGIILVSSLAVSQFCSNAFGLYAKYTATVTLVSGQISSLTGIMYIYDALIFVLMLFVLVTIFYVWWKPYEYRPMKAGKFDGKSR